MAPGAYYDNCDYDSAVEIATGDKAGTLSANAYQEVLFYKAYNGNYVNDRGAKGLARLVASHKLDLAVFKSAYYDNCDYDSAVEVAMIAK